MELGFDGIIDDHTVDFALLHVQMNRFQFIFGRNYCELHATLCEWIQRSECSVEC